LIAGVAGGGGPDDQRHRPGRDAGGAAPVRHQPATRRGRPPGRV